MSGMSPLSLQLVPAASMALIPAGDSSTVAAVPTTPADQLQMALVETQALRDAQLKFLEGKLAEIKANDTIINNLLKACIQSEGARDASRTVYQANEKAAADKLEAVKQAHEADMKALTAERERLQSQITQLQAQIAMYTRR